MARYGLKYTNDGESWFVLYDGFDYRHPVSFDRIDRAEESAQTLLNGKRSHFPNSDVAVFALRSASTGAPGAENPYIGHHGGDTPYA